MICVLVEVSSEYVGRAREKGHGGCSLVGESGMSVPLLTIAAHCPPGASTPLPALTGFNIRRFPDREVWGGCPPHLMRSTGAQGQGVADGAPRGGPHCYSSSRPLVKIQALSRLRPADQL